MADTQHLICSKSKQTPTGRLYLGSWHYLMLLQQNNDYERVCFNKFRRNITNLLQQVLTFDKIIKLCFWSDEKWTGQ